MPIEVRFYAQIREKIGIDKVVLENCNSFSQLLTSLRKILGDKIGIIFDEHGNLDNSILVGVNDRLVSQNTFIKIRFRNGDKIDIMPIGSGG